MESKIIGKEYPLKQIFSKDFDYYIPAYQRPYSWTTEEADALFVDLFDSFTKKDENYFLGSIVLIKEEDRPKAQVIDGQQRLTTLTMLIAAIASQLSDDDTKKECLKYLSEPGSKLEKLESKPRLHLRDKDRDFFNKYIQNLKLDDLIGLDVNSLMNESQQHIRENCKLFLERLNVSFKNDEDELVDFSVFLMNNCYMVAVSTSSEHSAFRIFNVMNSRGMDLLPIDKIKSDVIGQIPENEQQKYTDKWEDMEIQTTRSGFNDLFTHIRMICAKTKPRQNLLDDFTQTVMTMYSSKELIDEILEPYSEAYTTLVNKTYKSVTHAEEINRYLFWLNKIENSDWMPSAVKFFADRKNDSEYVLWFVKNLERLASYLYITSKDVNKRVERYKSVLDEMESNPYHSLNDPILSIELNNTEKKEFVEKLNSDIYLMTGKRRNYVMLRLNAFVSDGANQFDYEPNIFTIEHVLPQTIEPGSEWDILWNDKEQRQQWRNKIANLVLLTRRMNSAAKNYDFEQKKEKYFKGKNGTTTYPLTTQVLYENKWTPAVVEKRQKELIKCFVDHWKLNYTEPPVQQDGSELFFIKNKRGANAEGYVSPQRLCCHPKQ